VVLRVGEVVRWDVDLVRDEERGDEASDVVHEFLRQHLEPLNDERDLLLDLRSAEVLKLEQPSADLKM
jgi:hypothetical protein